MGSATTHPTARAATTDVVRLVLATARPAVECFFAEIAASSRSPLEITTIAVAPHALDDWAAELEEAGAAVVDVEPDSMMATRFCEELLARNPSISVMALVCCPHSATPWNLRALVAAGVSSIIDLEMDSQETRRALIRAVRGEAVLHLQLGGERGLLRDILAGQRRRGETHLRLLGLVALGLSDQEIGRRLHLSPHTVKHHIEQLRGEVGAKNRVELAAWAGRHGFYSDAGRESA